MRWAAAIVVGVTAGLPGMCLAAPTIVAGDVVVLELVASDPAALLNVDMLAFDTFGNLFANRETFGSSGGVSYVDIGAGTATVLVTGISRADGITSHPSGALYVTSELWGASTTNRVYRIDVSYDVANVPVGATATSITTTIAIDDPEGIVALTQDNGFGLAGDLYVCEDRSPGRIFHLELTPGNTATATILVGTSANLHRPEGLTIGDFGGLAPGPMLFTAETLDGNVLDIGSNGVPSIVGNPGAVSLTEPDNVTFGHDGKLYVSEDVGPTNGRIIRIAADGTHEVLLSGFNFPQGMAFDFEKSDLYVAEQGASRIWRARFATATGDADVDGDVDLGDAAAFGRCFDSAPVDPACLVFDYDRSDVIDLSDWNQLAAAMTGP